jgi:hypothetical protein
VLEEFAETCATLENAGFDIKLLLLGDDIRLTDKELVEMVNFETLLTNNFQYLG